jgi:hypothetical protein
MSAFRRVNAVFVLYGIANFLDRHETMLLASNVYAVYYIRELESNCLPPIYPINGAVIQ